jgi:hypothetical protein
MRLLTCQCEFTAELEAHVAQHLFEVEFWGRASAMSGDVFLGVASVDLAPLVFHKCAGPPPCVPLFFSTRKSC